tara:strand:+ start:93 stop:683 length:591 start_codon:yes stop_codon:yes gene_type:complete
MTLDDLLRIASDRYKQSPEDILQLMDIIAYHETGHDQRMQPTARQILNDGSYGKGAGLYQFEKGPKQGGATAMQRLRNIMLEGRFGPKLTEEELPEFMNYDRSIGVDASLLDKEEQDMMFLANILEDPRSNATFLGVTPDNLVNYYRDIHNAGTVDRSASFLESLKDFKKQQADKKIEEIIDGTISSPADEAFITN